MKLLFDQNISFRILKRLNDFYNGSSHVTGLGLMNASDLEIWEYANNNQHELEEFYLNKDLGCFEIFRFN